MPNVSNVSAPEQEKFVTIHDLAAFMGVHYQTVRKMWKDGKLPEPRKIGKKAKWLESDIRKFFKINGSILPKQ